MRDVTLAVGLLILVPLRVSAASVVAGRVIAGPVTRGVEPKPIAGARVLALRALDVEPGDDAFTLATTAADGSFRLELEYATEPLHVVVEAAGRETIHRVVSRGQAEALEIALLAEAKLEGSVADGDQRPLADARVEIEATREMSSRVPDKEVGPAAAVIARLFPSAVTGKEGAFHLEGLAPRSYRVRVAHPGYFTHLDPAVTVDRERTALMRIFLQPSSRLAVSVLGSDGKPLAGAQVRLELDDALVQPLIEARLTAPARVWHDGVLTDASGTAIIAEVTPDIVVRVVVGHRELGEENLSVRTAAAGETASVTARLRAGVRVAGVLLDEAGEAVAEAVVHLREPGFTPKRPGVQMGRRADTDGSRLPGGTSADGGFVLPRVAAGEYEVWVQAFGREWRTNDAVTVKAGQPIDDLRLRVELGSRIEGRVFDDLGALISGATIHAFAPRGTGPRGRPETRSRGDGSFTLRGVGGKTCSLTAWGLEGYVPATVDELPTNARDVKLVLTRAGAISGHVTLADGSDALSVFLTPTPETVMPTRVAREWSARERVVPAVDGKYVVGDLIPGTWTIALGAPGHLGTKRTGVVVKAGVTTLGVDARLERGASFRGVVMDGAGGGPVAGAAIEALPSPKPERMPIGMVTAGPKATSDSTGSFELTGMAAARAVLIVTHPAYATSELEVTAGETESVREIALLRGGTIEGRVIDGEGVGVATARIVVSKAGLSGPNGLAGMSMAGPDGRFRVEHVAAGRYDVEMVQEGGSEGDDWHEQKLVEVAEGDTVTVEFRRGSGRLIGRVLSGSRPLVQARLRFFAVGDEGRAAAVSGDDGSYEALGIHPGKWEVAIHWTRAGGDPAFFRTVLDVPPGTLFEHDFVVGTAVVRGRVEDADSGDPIAGARVGTSRQGAWKTAASGESDGDGRFELELAETGGYEVNAWHKDYAEGEPVAIDLGAAPAEVRLVLSRGDLLSGRVVDPSGAAISDAVVIASIGEKTVRRALCEADGRFALALHRGSVVTLAVLPAERAPVLLYGLSAGVEPITVVAASGGALRVTLPVGGQSAPKIEFELRDALGGILVPLLWRAPHGLIEGNPELGGIVRFPRLAAGIYTVVARSGESVKTVEVEVADGRESAIVIDL